MPVRHQLSKKAGKCRVYPWEKWLKKRRTPLTIKRGVDFSISVSGMIGSLRNRGYSENLRLQLKRVGKDGISVQVVGEWR